jgi:indolepyruvate ferredoxin oxidoreductase alpha subunit
MKGFEVIGMALRAACDCIYFVPGYPVTELSEIAGAELVINEKVALEYALGDSLSGRRAAVVLKNVGLNSCSDPLVHATAQGLLSGVVVVAGDDPEATGSQAAEDSRYFGELAEVPVIEPDPGTCAISIEEAFEASENFSRVCIVRVTPPVLFTDSKYRRIARKPGTGELAPQGLTMHGKDMRAKAAVAAMFAWSRASPLNVRSPDGAGTGGEPGTARIVTVYPPPWDPESLAAVRETGRPFVREHRYAEPPVIAVTPERFHDRGFCRTFCKGCPFYGVIVILQKRGIPVIADAGCSILAMNPPFRIARASYGLGASLAVAARSTGVALTGDYAILHNGISALIDIYEKGLPLLTVVLVNRRMGMTGGQEVPDPLRYLTWADPAVCDAGDSTRLEELIRPVSSPRTVLVNGSCPEERRHETVEC